MLDISQVDKEKFISDLNEDDFREKIVRRLFKSLGFLDGRDTCGPEEYGKDAIFIEKDKFGVENATAVQTKVGNINLSGDPAKNLHALVAQLRTALNHPHVCTRTKSKSLPLTVFCIASGRINQAARNYIAEQLQDPRLRFLDRDDLITKIDEACPELWSGIVADVSPYLKALAHRVEELSFSTDPNPVHSSLGAFAAASDQRFVDVRLGFHKPRFVKRLGQISEEFEYEEISGTSLLSGTSVRALLLGDAGTGKSTLLVRLAYMLAKQSIGSVRNYRIPIFARAHELVGRASEPHYNVLESIVSKIQDLSSPPFVVEDFDDGRVVLLVDGLDELADTNDRQDVLDFLSLFAERYPKCSIAVTSRPYGSLEKLSGLDRFKRYRISPLSMDGASKMLQGIQPNGKGSDSSWRKEILRRIDAVHGIELNPLLVTVFAVSSGFEKRDIPANMTELFSKFTELMLGRWDEKKGLSHQYQAKVKDHLLSAFAFELQCRGDTRFSRREFVEFAKAKLEEMNLLADLEVIISETVDRSGLMRGDEQEMEFKHHLLQEFFASKGIPSLEFIKSVAKFEWWRNSIVFYFGGSPDSANDLLELASDPSIETGRSYLTVGLALQACYLSKLEERIEVWKWVVEAAAQSSMEQLKSPAAKYPVTSFVTSYIEGRDSLALGGLEKPGYAIDKWALRSTGDSALDELRRFWYAAALVETSNFEKLKELLDAKKFETDLLATSIHFGCFFSLVAKHVADSEKQGAQVICDMLDRQVDFLRVQITKEFRGQLLEYRGDGVVALDAEEPALN